MVTALIVGCATTSQTTAQAPQQPDLEPYQLERRIVRLKEMVREKERSAGLQDSSNKDYILENMLLAKTAFDAHEWPTAKKCLKRVIDFYDVYTEQQKKAGSASLAEKEIHRFFRGEPFERSFVFFYYGLVHLIESDAQEGGRSFYSAIAADAAFSEAFSHDNALFYYFLGVAYLEKDDFGNASGAFQNCERLMREQGNPLTSSQRKALGFSWDEVVTPDAIQNAHKPNVILLVELGYSPNKAVGGTQNQHWRYYSLPSRAKSARIKVNDHELGEAVGLCDTVFQASTSGRASDKVALQEVKAFAKSAAIFIPYGGGFVSTLWEVEGDKRTWANLPQYLQVYGFSSDNQNLEIEIEFLDGQGNPLRNLSQSIQTQIDPKRLNVITTKFYETRQ